MKTILRRTLHDLLIQDDISLESNIVNDLMYKMIGIEPANTNTGFNLEVYQYNKDDETIRFNLPEMSGPELDKCLKFFTISFENYRVGKSLTLDNDFVIKELLPQFQTYYANLKESNPSLIAKYKVDSRPVLESTAKNTIKDYSTKALMAILANPVPQTPESISKRSAEITKYLEANPEAVFQGFEVLNSLKNNIFSLVGELAILNEAPEEYRVLINMNEKFKQYLTDPVIAVNKELSNLVARILEGIALFTRYNRCESVIANNKTFSEMESFLNSRQLAAQKCDVVEDALLLLAGASLGPKGDAKHRIGGDKSRLVFDLKDISKENADKIVNYCVKMGDDSATLGYGYRKHGSSVAESACLRVSSQSAFDIDEPREIIESHSIEVDGAFFYNSLLGPIKDTIDEMFVTQSEKMATYVKASEPLLKKLAEASQKLSENKSTLFQAVKADDVVSTTTATSTVSL